MRAFIFLFLAFSAGGFAWLFVLGRRERRITGKWGRRLGLTVVSSFVLVAALFAAFTTTTWRIF